MKFQKFPPVLCLHLLRFEYDYNLSQHRKINDSYSFDYRLDLSEFLEKPGCSSCSYKLLSILVHSGDNSSGHYVSFINPNLDEQVASTDDSCSSSNSCARFFSSFPVVEIRRRCRGTGGLNRCHESEFRWSTRGRWQHVQHLSVHARLHT